MNAKIDHSIMNKDLLIGSSKTTFPWPIVQTISFDRIVIVRLEATPGSIFNENVFGVRPDGQIVWQITPLQHVYDDSPYTSISAAGDSVKLFNWDGDELTVDPLSGNILAKGYRK